MYASESLRIFVVRGQIAQSAQPFSKGYSIEERPVQRRSAPAITTTRSIWRPFLGRAQDIPQRHARREAACGRSSRDVRRSDGAASTVSLCQSGRGRRHQEGGSLSILHSSRLAGRRAHQQRHGRRDALPIVVVRGDRFFAPSTTVRDLIRVANLVEEIQISGGPSVDRVGALRDRSVNRSRRQP